MQPIEIMIKTPSKLKANSNTVLFISPWEYSHFRLHSNIALKLYENGNEIIFCGFPDYKEKLEKEFTFIEIAALERPVNSLTKRYEKQSQLSGYPALLNLVKDWNSDILLYLKYLPKAIEHKNIDLILFDQALVGISTLIDYLKIPSVEICNALAIVPREFLFHPVPTAPYLEYTYNPFKLVLNWRAGFRSGRNFYNNLILELNSFRIKNGMKRLLFNYQIFSNESELKLTQLIPELDYPKLFRRSRFHFLGSFSYQKPSEIDAPYNLEEISKPIIYATIGTLQNMNLHILKHIEQACEQLEVQLVIALGMRLDDSSPIKSMFKKETIVYDFPPQQQLMQQANLTIIHAGLNSTLESLCYGKPMICIPITHEQPQIAERMKRAKVAEVINLEELSSSKVSKSIKKIMSDESYTKRAENYGKLIRKAGGLEKAIELIEAVLN